MSDARNWLQVMTMLAQYQKRIETLEKIERPIVTTGSFTPTLVGAGTAGTFTYTANATIVEYARIANQVFYNGRIAITAITVAPVGAMTIRGWVITPVSDANMAIAGGGSFILWGGITLPAGYTYVGLQAANGSTQFALERSGTNVAAAAVVGADMTGIAGAIELRFFGHYRCA